MNPCTIIHGEIVKLQTGCTFVGLRQNTFSVAQHVIKGDQTYTDISTHTHSHPKASPLTMLQYLTF